MDSRAAVGRSAVSRGEARAVRTAQPFVRVPPRVACAAFGGVRVKKTGVGIVGLGLAVKPHALALRELASKVHVVGAFSPSPVRRAEFAATYLLPVVDSFEALCDNPGINALVILTPPHTHAKL